MSLGARVGLASVPLVFPHADLSEPEARHGGIQETEKGARPAGEVQQPHHAVAEDFDGRRERAVEDALLDELGHLQEGVAFARELGQILIKVAQETSWIVIR